ncbi:MAG: preprotein translocase subunit SecY, partial [Candidatus Lokiarchaeota archaeon]|nr:preprotein translocase subunit SecY [Candidatus Lokiarchaeota archaeon]
KFFSPFVRIMPEIKQPQREVQFKEKLLWTVVVLLIYLIMSNIPLYGVTSADTADYYYWLRVILASQKGTLTELGIGPIVTSGLIMQLLLGSKIIKIDMSDPYDRSMFSGSQKVFAMFLTVLNILAYLAGGAFGDLTIANATFVFLQLLFSGVVIILLDEILQKGWGIGSGVSLFIATGVAGQIFWNLFSFVEAGPGQGARGIIIAFFQSLTDPSIDTATLFFRPDRLPSLFGGITTLAIFLIIIWFESTKIEIPLAYKGYRGFKGKYPMKLLYVSNIPVILVNALYANFLFFGQIIAGPSSNFRNAGSNWFLDLIGTFKTGTSGVATGSYLVPTGGLLYYLTPPQGLEELIADPIRSIIYLVFFIFLCVMLGRVWVDVSGLAPKDIAQQIIDSGMQIPGFRSSDKIIERILKRYIPTLIILNGFIIAIMSFFADSLGALTSGTGLLIAIGIVHQYSESLAKEMAAMQYPGMRALLGMD